MEWRANREESSKGTVSTHEAGHGSEQHMDRESPCSGCGRDNVVNMALFGKAQGTQTEKKERIKSETWVNKWSAFLPLQTLHYC